MLVAGKYSIQIVFESHKQESLKSFIDKTPMNSLAPMMTHGGTENIFETKSFCWLSSGFISGVVWPPRLLITGFNVFGDFTYSIFI